MKHFSATLLIILCYSTILHSQNVGIGTSSPKPSAALDVTATDKGMLMPRLTTAQRKAIVNPERGLLVFDTDRGTFMLFDGENWKFLPLQDEDKATLVNRQSTAPVLGEHFGQAVDISGNYAIIGAPFYASPVTGNKMGEAYIFFKDATGWKMQARLVAPDSASFEFFGCAVAIYGDYCVIGKGVNTQGKVYVYKRNGTAWTLDAGVPAPAGTFSGAFSYSVDITLSTNGTVLVAAGDPGAGNGGKVFTFSRNNVNNTWAYLQTLSPPDLGDFNSFGLSVSIHKDYLAVGAPNQDNIIYNATHSGAAYIYVFGGGVFTQQYKYPGSWTNALLGNSVSVYEDKVAIGSPGGHISNTTGATILKRDGASWNIWNDYFYDGRDAAGNNHRYGQTVSINNNQLLIGAPSGFIFPTGSSSGSSVPGEVYLYVSKNGGTYFLKEKMIASTSYIGDLFGHSVAIDANGNYITGVPYQNATTTNGILQDAGGVFFGYYNY